LERENNLDNYYVECTLSMWFTILIIFVNWDSWCNVYDMISITRQGKWLSRDDVEKEKGCTEFILDNKWKYRILFNMIV